MKRALLLRRSTLALERIGDLFEIYLTEVCGVHLHADAEAAASSSQELERSDAMTELDEELAAAIELLEDEGVTVPAESYRKLGLEPPRNEREPSAEELAAEQPAPPAPPAPPDIPEPPEPDEPITARRRV